MTSQFFIRQLGGLICDTNLKVLNYDFNMIMIDNDILLNQLNIEWRIRMVLRALPVSR